MDKDKPNNYTTSHSEGGTTAAAVGDGDGYDDNDESDDGDGDGDGDGDSDAKAAANPILISNPFATFPAAPDENATASSGSNNPFNFGTSPVANAGNNPSCNLLSDAAAAATTTTPTAPVSSDNGSNSSAVTFVFLHPLNKVPSSSGSNPFSNPFTTFSASPPVADASASRGGNNFGAALIITAIQHKQPPSTILQAINDHPEELRVKSNVTIENSLFSVQLLPLHVALHEKMPSDIISAMLEKYPEAAREKGGFDNTLPLHLACQGNVPVDVIAVLLSAYPDAAKEKGNNMLPLYLACQSKAPVEVIAELLSVFPDAAKEKDGISNMLPLHLSCQRNASVEVIAELLTSYPDAAREKDTNRRLPVHIACERGASAEVINSLLTAHPHGVRDKDSNGSTSLHSASSRYDLDLVLLLLNRGADPNVKDNSGRTPRQMTHNYYHGQSDNRKTIQDILERWGVLMAIKLLRKLRVFH